MKEEGGKVINGIISEIFRQCDATNLNSLRKEVVF